MKQPPITPAQFIGLWLATLVTLFATAVLLRKAQGRPFFQPKFADVEIRQSWISGASSRGLFGTFARVNNALWIVLAGDVLHVGAHFPFNMLMPNFLVRLDLDIPIAAMSSVVERSAFFGIVWVRITYDVSDEGPGPASTAYVELRPRGGDRFVEILREKARAAREKAGKTFD